MMARKVGLLLIAGLLCAVITLGAELWHSGYRIYVVHTGSMEPTLMPGDIVIDRPAVDGYRPGQIITFRHSDTTTDVVTHRITAIAPSGLISTKGDANATADAWAIRPDQVQGVRALTVPRVGYLLVFMRQPSGVGAIVTGIFALVLLWGLFFPSQVVAVIRAPAHRAAGRARRRGRQTKTYPDLLPMDGWSMLAPGVSSEYATAGRAGPSSAGHWG